MIYEDPNNYQLELDDYNGTLISLIPLMSKLACRVFANSSFIAGKQEKHFSASRYPRSGFLRLFLCITRARVGLKMDLSSVSGYANINTHSSTSVSLETNEIYCF